MKKIINLIKQKSKKTKKMISLKEAEEIIKKGTQIKKHSNMLPEKKTEPKKPKKAVKLLKKTKKIRKKQA